MITEDNNYRVMRLFFDKPEKAYHIREIARLVRLSPPGVIKIVSRLKKEGLLISKREKVVENVRASKTDRFLRLKKYHNVERLFEIGLVEALRDAYQDPEAIVLFGSCSKGEDISTSDVDIAVIAAREAKINTKKFERVLDKKINVYVVQPKKSEPEFLNSLANGTVLFGFLEVF